MLNGCHGRVTDGRGAAHEQDAFDTGGHLRMSTQEQRDVGQRCARHQGDLLPGTDRRHQLTAQQLHGRQRTHPAVRRAGESAEAVRAVHVAGIVGRDEHGMRRTASDRDVTGAGRIQDIAGVGGHLVDTGVAHHAGHRAQLDAGMADREQQ
jgi:hypothetical protein